MKNGPLYNSDWLKFLTSLLFCVSLSNIRLILSSNLIVTTVDLVSSSSCLSFEHTLQTVAVFIGHLNFGRFVFRSPIPLHYPPWFIANTRFVYTDFWLSYSVKCLLGIVRLAKSLAFAWTMKNRYFLLSPFHRAFILYRILSYFLTNIWPDGEWGSLSNVFSLCIHFLTHQWYRRICEAILFSVGFRITDEVIRCF